MSYLSGCLVVMGVLIASEEEFNWYEMVFAVIASWLMVGLILGRIFKQ